MEKPISHAVVQVLKKISFAVLGVWIIAILNNIHVALLEKYASIHPEFITIEFIFLAGIVFILAQLFKRSVEMHSENNSKT